MPVKRVIPCVQACQQPVDRIAEENLSLGSSCLHLRQVFTGGSFSLLFALLFASRIQSAITISLPIHLYLSWYKHCPIAKESTCSSSFTMSTEEIPMRPSIGVAKHVSSHPLSPLTSSEITNAVKLVQALYLASTRLQYKAVTLQEPVKADVVPYLDAEHNGGRTPSIERKAFVCYYIRNTVR